MKQPVSASHVGAELDGFVGAAHFAAGGADIPPANGHPESETEHSAQVGQAADGGGDSGNISQNDTGHIVPVGLLALDDLAPLNSDDHSISQSHSLSSSAEFAEPFGGGLSLTTDSLYGSHEDSLSSLHASDPLGGSNDTSDELSSPTSVVIGMPAVALDAGDNHSLEHPAVISDARGGGSGGGGGHIGSTTPSPYTTHSGTNVDIHLTFDSSVGKAPAGFVSTVEKVADFFASSLQHSTQMTINIDVGYGEVDGHRMGAGALGESVTNLLPVSLNDLQTAYTQGYLSDVTFTGSPSAGNLYVSDAEGKALGFAVSQAIDGYVGFSSQSGIFDYNNSDGVSQSTYDFYGVVAHEFSEVMGRILLAGSAIGGVPSYMAYDFFHFNTNGQDFSGDGGYFSTDKGATNLAYFNNPSNGGDAGDWANTGTSNSGGSVNDAFNAFGAPGVTAPVTHTDLWALHAVGFDLVQPTTV
jgi:hypothetical protein